MIFSLFWNRNFSVKNKLTFSNIKGIYDYLYKQKILQLSYGFLEKLSLSNDIYAEKMLFDTKKYVKKTLCRNNILQKELCILSKILDENHVEHISLKGPLFSLIYFNEPGKRVCGDIDLMIDYNDIMRVVMILEEAGYEIKKDLFNESLKYHYHFEVSKKDVIFEIHWNIDYGKNNYWKYLLENSYFLEINNWKVRVLNDEAQFVLFVISISKDWFTKSCVSKYLDLFQIIKRESIDYKSVYKVIEEYGLTQRCYAVLVCLQHLCKLSIWPKIRVGFLTRIFTLVFLTKYRVLMQKRPCRFVRKMGERLLWKDISFTTVPNIYKNGRKYGKIYFYMFIMGFGFIFCM